MANERKRRMEDKTRERKLSRGTRDQGMSRGKAASWLVRLICKKEELAMKGIFKAALVVMGAMAMVFTAGCWDYSDDPGYDTNCCAPPPPPCCAPPQPIEEWYALTDWYTLEVGEECAGGCGFCQLSPACGDCCTWHDSAYAVDTLEFTCLDDNLVDLQFHYVLSNWSNQTVPVWVQLCDDWGCEDVIAIDLWPGEVLEDQVWNPVLDSLMSELDDCFFFYGDQCYLNYSVEVDLGQDCVCAPVTVDYFYNGLYVY